MGNSYQVIVAERAKDMLIESARFLANVSEKAANEFIEEFQKKTDSLSEFPERYPWLDSPYITKRKYHKLPFSKDYLLIYQIKDDKVYVDYVLDCRQDYRWLL